MIDENEDTSGVGLSFDMFASLGLSLGGLKAELQRMNDREEAAARRGRANLPRQITKIQQSTSATLVDLLDMEGPQPGRKWEARVLATVSATGAGFVAMATTFTTWYVGQKITGNAAGVLPLNLIRWQFPVVPAFNDFSGDTISVLPGEHLLAGLTGIPAAPTQIMCIAVINDLPLFVGSAVQSG